MKVTLKLFASLSDLLPPEAAGHAIDLQLNESVTPHQLLDQCHVPRHLARLVFRNGVFITPEERDRPVLRHGDVVAVWPPVAGG